MICWVLTRNIQTLICQLTSRRADHYLWLLTQTGILIIPILIIALCSAILLECMVSWEEYSRWWRVEDIVFDWLL